MEYAYQFRIYPTQKQEEQINRTFGCTRFVFNYYLAQRIALYKEEGKGTSWMKQSNQLTKLKQLPEYAWLNEVERSALVNALRNLDAAYKNFFRRVKNGEKPGFPRFKSKHDSHQSYRSSSPCIHVEKDAVYLPRIGRVKCRVSRPVEGRIVSATISRVPSGKYYVALGCTEVDIEQYPPTGGVVGLDVGLRSFAVSSDGTEYPNPKHLKKSEKKLARLQRKMARRTKGGSNWEKTRVQVARLHEHIANQRADSTQKLSTELIRNNDIICIEGMNVSKMMEHSVFAKEIADAGWGEFRRQLEYKALWHEKEVVRIDAGFPSNRICSDCGAELDASINPSIKTWTCPYCGSTHERCHNAAKNILTEGVRKLTQ